jgi:hypothetical protein
MAMWEMNGGQIIASPGLPNPGSTWHVAANPRFV